MANNQWVSCPGKIYISGMNEEKKGLTVYNLTIGQDNPKKECIVGDVSTIFNGVLAYHHGPYDGITIHCKRNAHSFIYHIFLFLFYFIFIFIVAYSPIVVDYFLLEKS
jgi:hypothetical protein